MRGSVRRRGDGRWQVRVYLGRDPATRRIRLRERTVRGTKKEAERVLSELLTEADQQPLSDKHDITVGQLLEAWLAQNESDFSPKTVLETRGFIKRTIVPAIGGRRVVDLTTRDLDAFYLRLRNDGGKGHALAPSTIRRIHGIIRRSLTQAVRWGVIRHNPAVGVSPPRVPKPEVHPPSVEQLAEMLAAASVDQPELGTYIVLAASSGARRSEILALRWKDLDFDTGTLVIGRGIVIGEAGVVEKDTKTHQIRRLSLDTTTLAELQRHRNRAAEVACAVGVDVSGDAYIFSSAAAGTVPWHPNSISRSFRALADSVGADNVRLHDLRHYVASQLLASGVDIRTVAGRLGHRDPSTTLNVYAHFIPEADQKAAAVLGGLLDAAVSNRGGDATR
jgi:integrase